MLKFLVLAFLVAGVIAFFLLRNSPKRPPRDWRRGGDDGGPIPPADTIGRDTSRKPAQDALPADTREKVTGDTGSPDSDGGSGGDGGGD